MQNCPKHSLSPEAPRPCLPPSFPIHIHAIIPEHLHLVLEGLSLLSCGLGHLEHLHSHIAMPPPTKHGAKRARPDPLQQLHLTGWHLPVIARIPVPKILLWATWVASQGPAHIPYHSACGAPHRFPLELTTFFLSSAKDFRSRCSDGDLECGDFLPEDMLAGLGLPRGAPSPPPLLPAAVIVEK